MLFNSYEFLLVFLPISLGGFFLFCQVGISSLVTGWLVIISLIFYGYWDLKFLLLLLASAAINWLIGEVLSQLRSKLLNGCQSITNTIRGVLFLGIAFNLGLIGYFKYINFFLVALNSFGTKFEGVDGLILPLGISFYTFEQISYLVGVAIGKMHYSWSRFLLFVTFFPHLIAGPILNIDELIPQFRALNYRFCTRSLAIGFTVFTIGLCKKTVIADSIAGYATPIFAASDRDQIISFFVAWQAAIAYTLQLYFDFSGYSDMAIGLARMFNIKLPINFFSPYKAISISDFWRRWHITLSRFLRDYLYIPLGGSHQGETRLFLNLLITMLLGGFWHGANWTYIVWGGLHGTYLCIDRGWQNLRLGSMLSGRLSQIAARALTFLAVVISWVIFRSDTLAGAGRILHGMMGLDGLILPEIYAARFQALSQFGVEFGTVDDFGGIQSTVLILSVLASVFLLPNLYEFMKCEPVGLDVYKHLESKSICWWVWKPNVFYALLTGVLFCVGIGFCGSHSEFLYFQF